MQIILLKNVGNFPENCSSCKFDFHAFFLNLSLVTELNSGSLTNVFLSIKTIVINANYTDFLSTCSCLPNV